MTALCVCATETKLKTKCYSLQLMLSDHKSVEQSEILDFHVGAVSNVSRRLRPHADLIDGYTGERAGLEEQLRQKEELQLSLEQELQVRHSREEEHNYPSP